MVAQKFIQDPYSAAIGGFSKVTHFLRDALMAMDVPGDAPAPVLPEALIAEAQQDLGLAIKTLGETGFEMVTTVGTMLSSAPAKALRIAGIFL